MSGVLCNVLLSAGKSVLSALGIALAAHFSLYPVMLLCPLALMVNKVRTNSCYTRTTYKIKGAIMIVFVLP